MGGMWEDKRQAGFVGGEGGGGVVGLWQDKAPLIAVKWRNRCRKVERALWLVIVNTPGY